MQSRKVVAYALRQLKRHKQNSPLFQTFVHLNEREENPFYFLFFPLKYPWVFQGITVVLY